MGLISGHFRDYFIWILVFIMGCIGNHPPDAMKINAPASVTVEEPLMSPGVSSIKLMNDGQLVISYMNQDGILVEQKTKEDDEKWVMKALDDLVKWSGGPEKINLVIEVYNKTSTSAFEELFEYLRKKKIYHYKLVTLPGQ